MEENIKEVENALKLRNLLKTRWTNRAESIHASYEVITNTLSAIHNSGDFDTSTKVTARSLYDEMISVDFVLSMMFMKNIMPKTKQMMEALQAEELNIVDAMTIIKATVDNLRRINEDSHAMDAEIHAGIAYTRKLGCDPEAEFNRKHRVRRPPSRIDDNPDLQVTLTMMQFYRREFKTVLDVQIVQLGDNLIQCLEAVKPLATVLQHHRRIPTFRMSKNLLVSFPQTCH